MTKVAFIGLGRMGHGMAGRYLDAGHSVAVWNRSRSKAEDLIARGARWSTSPADAAIDADAVVTMVADDEASRAVWLGLPGAAASGKLTLLVGAAAADLERARPYLAPIGSTIRHFGPAGAGTVYKLINNLLGAMQIAGLAEGLAIAEQAGLDMDLVLEAIQGGV